jgi:hypothetical protein
MLLTWCVVRYDCKILLVELFENWSNISIQVFVIIADQMLALICVSEQCSG